MVNINTPMIDTIDMEILMHRDVHFGGSFDVMLEYYMQQGVGEMPDFEIDEILRLKKMEEKHKDNLSDQYLSDMAKDQVKAAKKMYQDLRNVYSDEKASPESVLLSDLILSEEELPEKEIEAIVEKGKDIVSTLIYLLSSHTFYEPLNPGYGRSPIFAAKCLAQIQDERAIPALFEALGQDNFFTDEEIIKALASFGNQSKTFLITQLQSEVFSNDNEYAAIALSGFTDDEEIARASLEVLEKEETLKKTLFASYLVFACSSLTKGSEQERFIAVTKKEGIPQTILEEMIIVIKNWKRTA
ncbi:MAG: HEAT repeat domain-containing protein [Candidatus Neptunochlamydia sp.]|nr:HEAT repeat domain-containing protein [Candidatus Neptunochlamydia sp.]